MKMPRLFLLPLLASLAAPVAAAEDPALIHARRVLRKAPIIDGHNDVWNMQAMETYAALLREAEFLRSQKPNPPRTD